MSLQRRVQISTAGAGSKSAPKVSIRTTPQEKMVEIFKISSCAVAASAALMVGSLHFSAAAQASTCPNFTTGVENLQYCDEKQGDGDAPVKGSFVKVHYSGRLDSESASGVFDSSYDRGRPLAFSIGTGQVIRGWDLGILGDGKSIPPMKPGGKRKLIIPSDLGYGSKGAGGVIPPNATLYFDVEYLGGLGQKK